LGRHLNREKIFDKLSYIIPAVLVIFAAIYFTKVSNTSKLYRYGGHDCDSIGYHLDDYCLLSVFDDILSKSPVLRANYELYSSTQYCGVFRRWNSHFVCAFRKESFYFLGAMGAMTAILLLIFKDTILGFVASIQMSVYDMVRVGDWIAMPKYDADGLVMSIKVPLKYKTGIKPSLRFLPMHL
jgi:miniconductance mechanosensitive channel